MIFSEKEIKQVAYLMGQASSLRAIDRRKITKRIERWAVAHGLCMYKCKHGHVSNDWLIWDCPESQGNKCSWRLFANDQTWVKRFDAEIDLPAEILWHFVQQFLYRDLPDGTREAKGHSLSKDRGWRELDIYEDGCRFATERDHIAKMTILLKLDLAGYITFQHAGNIWQITPRMQ